MGLDMYLESRKFIWDRDKDKYKVTGPSGKIGVTRLKSLVFGECYWRKANAIHKWFVDNVQSGEDDCNSYYVSRDQLRELLDLVTRVLADKSLASELLPTQSGFFFGGEEYDDYYFESLEYTKTELTRILESNSEDEMDYYYQSSW